MDEPTSSLDDREVAVLFEVIRRLRPDGVSVGLRQPQARRALRRSATG
jgi:energy-coupling factor transporter ATP-binding protein EcfA2